MRYQARREAAALRPEAERLVEQLWREKNEPGEVVKAIRADRVLSEALRQAALRRAGAGAKAGSHPPITLALFLNDSNDKNVKSSAPSSIPRKRIARAALV